MGFLCVSDIARNFVQLNRDNMATGGKVIMQSATATDTTPGRKTSSEEPWATASGERYKAREDLRNLFQTRRADRCDVSS